MFNFNDPTIASAWIQMCGTILAALIAALFAKKIVKESVQPYFYSYSDLSHDLRDITKKAKSDIIIVVAVGDNLLAKYKSELERNLKTGISIKYLLLDRSHFRGLEQYINGHSVDDKIYDDVLKILRNLKGKYKNHFDVRIFNDFMAASYIGVDISPTPPASPPLPSAVIQVMLYQYHTIAKDSPITYLSPRTDKKHYEYTVKSIEAMWEQGVPMEQIAKIDRLQ